MGEPGRFRNGSAFRSLTGLAPKASETGNTDRNGQPMSKAGSLLLRTTLVRAADNAPRTDPQLARLDFDQMVTPGKSPLGAIFLVAAKLAERALVVMDRGTPWVRDADGRPAVGEETKAIIAERFTVPAEVRARRRSAKRGDGPSTSAHGA